MKNTKTKGARSRKLRENLIAYSFLVPSLAGVVLFSMIPLLVSLYVSLTDWNFMEGLGNWNFVGLANFKALLNDECSGQSPFGFDDCGSH